ncbi:MAG TPA: GtrA family protein [Nitrospiraceae bacterium]|nr:GtrA family protein [Nitrospiraceae bacterium]
MVEETLIRSHPRRIATFIGIGAVNTAIDVSAFAFLYGVAGLDVVTSNVLAFMFAVTNSYVLNFLITFADRRSRRSTLRSFARFLCVAVVAMGVSTVIVCLMSTLTHPLIAKLIAAGASTMINYIGSYKLVFAGGGGGGRRASEPSN